MSRKTKAAEPQMEVNVIVQQNKNGAWFIGLECTGNNECVLFGEPYATKSNADRAAKRIQNMKITDVVYR